MTPHQAWLVTQPLNARSKDFLPFGSILPPFLLFFAFFPPSFFHLPCGFLFLHPPFFVLFGFFATGLRKPPENWGAELKKNNSKDFLQLLRVACPKQSIQRLTCSKRSGLRAPLRCRSPCQRAISTSKGSSDPPPGSFTATFPESLQAPFAEPSPALCMGLFEKRRPLQRMLQPLPHAGLSPDPGSQTQHLFFSPFIFPPHLAVGAASSQL